MLVNSSSTPSDVLDNYFYIVCFYMPFGFGALRATILLTLSTLILYLGHQQWWHQRSFKTASHSDVFTYHMAVMDLFGVLGFMCYVCGTYTNHSVMVTVGFSLFYIPFYGEMCFHVLTCVERYLAVVHPIIYMGLRNVRGVRIRNISTGFVWLLSFGLVGIFSTLTTNNIIIPFLCILIFSIIIISFCSLSVLCVLIHPRPGGGGGGNEQVDQSKQRAFYTITVILSVLLLWFVGLFVSTIVSESPLLSNTVKCGVKMMQVCFNLPSSLVLRLLYLHRAGKLSCCYNKNKR